MIIAMLINATKTNDCNMMNEKIDTVPFEKLHGHLKGVIERYAFFITRRKQYVEDTAQEVFIKLWMKWPRLSKLTVDELEDYVYVITRNLLINEQKLAERNRKHFLNYSVCASESCWHDQVLMNEGFSIYRQALKQLPFKESAIYFLYENGNSREQIAAIVRRSANTVNNQLYSASQTVKKSLNKYFDFTIELEGRRKHWKELVMN